MVHLPEARSSEGRPTRRTPRRGAPQQVANSTGPELTSDSAKPVLSFGFAVSTTVEPSDARAHQPQVVGVGPLARHRRAHEQPGAGAQVGGGLAVVGESHHHVERAVRLHPDQQAAQRVDAARGGHQPVGPGLVALVGAGHRQVLTGEVARPHEAATGSPARSATPATFEPSPSASPVTTFADDSA